MSKNPASLLEEKSISLHYMSRYIRFIYSCIYKNKDMHIIENHHILPKSIWPEYSSFKEHPWNKAALTPREHFVAHWILAKALGGNMWYALHCMSYAHGKQHKRNYKITSKTYELIRYETSKLNSLRYISDDERLKKSINAKGENNPRYGIVLDNEIRIKISESLKGHKRSKESIESQKTSYKKYWESDEGLRRKEELKHNLKDNPISKGKKRSPTEKDRLRKLTSNTKWVNNGVKNKRIKEKEPLPEGYVYGRIKR